MSSRPIEKRPQGQNTLYYSQANVQSQSASQNQARQPPVRSDSNNARNDMQRMERKYSRHYPDSNGGTIAVNDSRTGPPSTSVQENLRSTTHRTPAESPRIARTTTIRQEDHPPRSSSLKRQADQGRHQPQRLQELDYRTTLSELELLFAEIAVAGFMDCFSFIKAKPEILDSHPKDFLREASNAVRSRKDKHARQCVARAILLGKCKDMSQKTIADYFSRISSQKGVHFKAFNSDFNSVLDELEERAAQLGGAKSVPEASPQISIRNVVSTAFDAATTNRTNFTSNVQIAPDASRVSSSMQRLSVAPRGQATYSRTEPTFDRHGRPLNNPAQLKPPDPKPSNPDDESDDDGTFGHKIPSRHAMHGPDDDDEDDDGTFGHHIKRGVARLADNEADYSDEPDFNPYGRHEDRSKNLNMGMNTKYARMKSDHGGHERAPRASRVPKGDDDDDDDDDGTFGHREILRPKSQKDEKGQSVREPPRDFRPILMSNDSKRRALRDATRDVRPTLPSKESGRRSDRYSSRDVQ